MIPFSKLRYLVGKAQKYKENLHDVTCWFKKFTIITHRPTEREAIRWPGENVKNKNAKSNEETKTSIITENWYQAQTDQKYSFRSS